MIVQAESMTQVERLQAMEELWDAICHNESKLEPPEWHKNILSDRKQKIQSGIVKFVTLEELKAVSH